MGKRLQHCHCLRRRLFGLCAACCCVAETEATDLAYGEYLAGECVTCHRADAEAAIPPIHALPAADFIKALIEYRDGERDHDLMRTVARSLGDAEMEALAAYFEQRDDKPE